MSRGRDVVLLDRCPLCGATGFVEHSVPEPNLYSEKIALALDTDEQQVLEEHANWRCVACGLLFKRRWFDEAAIRYLFTNVVPTHPKGWDSVLDRFSAVGLRVAFEQWANGYARSAVAEIRRGERELLSILDSITQPSGFDPNAAVTAIKRGDVGSFRTMCNAIAASIAEPAPFKRFAGFRSEALWVYLQSRSGGFHAYAEMGCPLWGLLPIAAARGVRAAFVSREEPNYWGSACANSGRTCVTRLLDESRISHADWSTTDRFPLIGLFQYLDHLPDPRNFLHQLFARATSAAIILDGVDSPVAIQHVTGWTEETFTYVARTFDKRLHMDFDEIRPSGNVLYLLAGS